MVQHPIFFKDVITSNLEELQTIIHSWLVTLLMNFNKTRVIPQYGILLLYTELQFNFCLHIWNTNIVFFKNVGVKWKLS